MHKQPLILMLLQPLTSCIPRDISTCQTTSVVYVNHEKGLHKAKYIFNWSTESIRATSIQCMSRTITLARARLNMYHSMKEQAVEGLLQRELAEAQYSPVLLNHIPNIRKASTSHCLTSPDNEHFYDCSIVILSHCSFSYTPYQFFDVGYHCRSSISKGVNPKPSNLHKNTTSTGVASCLSHLI
jgi:hypothetical protein